MASSVEDQLVKWESMNFIIFRELTKRRMEEAAELAVELRLRGIDAIVVQVAKEKKRALMTFDEEMAEKAKAVVDVFDH